ncbi:hypothetical protein D3C72_1758690 [compost metagenome]
MLVADGGAEVGKQAQVLAQAQDGLLRAKGAVERVVFPVAHSAKQDGVGFFGELEGGFGQRVAVGVIRHAADQGGLHLEREFQGFQNLDGFRDDFRTNAVTRQNCDFH